MQFCIQTDCSNLSMYAIFRRWNQHVRKYSDRKDAVDKVVEKVKVALEVRID